MTRKFRFARTSGHIRRAQDHLRKLLSPGDRALDATVGNGHDTCFLAGLVGPSGHIDGFDIQAAALDSAKRRIAAASIETSISWYQESHGKLAELIQEPLKAAIFNLGYLPGGDHEVITKAESTLQALQALETLIVPGGGWSVVCYLGHDGGGEEFQALKAWLAERDNDWLYTLWQRLNRPEAPVVFMGERAQDC